RPAPHTAGLRTRLRGCQPGAPHPGALRWTSPTSKGHRSPVPVRIHNLPLWLGEPESLLRQRAAQALGVPPAALQSVRIVRTVLDARKKGAPRHVHTVEVDFVQGGAPRKLPPGVTELEPPPPPPARVRAPEQRPIIVGTGPAGLFCALGLLERGVPSVLL